MKFGEKVLEWLREMPRATFNEIRAERDRIPQDRASQQALALEDRRAFARDAVRNTIQQYGWLPKIADGRLQGGFLTGPAMVSALGLEQLYKRAVDNFHPNPGPHIPFFGRSGPNPFLPALGGVLTGMLQGYTDVLKPGWDQ